MSAHLLKTLRYAVALGVALGLAACQGEALPSANADHVAAPVSTARGADGRTPRAPSPHPARTRTLVNPSGAEIVMLYHAIAGVRPPIEKWAEDSHRLHSASPPDKAQVRADLRAELETLAQSVNDVGRLHISIGDAALSTYDPAYGEFTIGALSPSSSIPFQEYQQSVNLRFDNALTAQIWKATPEQARAALDKLGGYPRASIDITLDVMNAVPSPRGGTITVRVVEYELHDARHGVRIVRNTL